MAQEDQPDDDTSNKQYLEFQDTTEGIIPTTASPPIDTGHTHSLLQNPTRLPSDDAPRWDVVESFQDVIYDPSPNQ